MDTYSRHCIMELWECNRDLLNDREKVEKMMVEAALEAGAEVREVAFHKFAPQGISGVVVISESHLTIHTFPDGITILGEHQTALNVCKKLPISLLMLLFNSIFLRLLSYLFLLCLKVSQN